MVLDRRIEFSDTFWYQGALLITATTDRWSEEQRDAADAVERRTAFAFFSALDEGRSREYIFRFASPEECLAAVESHNEILTAERNRILKDKLSKAVEFIWTDDALKLAVQCPQDRGEADRSETVSVYDPLSIIDVRNLLDFAAANGADSAIVARVCVRLTNAIPGMTCPNPYGGGEPYRRMRALGRFFYDNRDAGGTDANVRRIAEICNIPF